MASQTRRRGRRSNGPPRRNVAFADGHCDFVDRGKLLLQRYFDPTYRGTC